MSLPKAAAKNSYFSFSEHPPSSQLCTTELNLQRLIVWRTGCCLSDGSAICSVEESPGCAASFDRRCRIWHRKRGGDMWKLVGCPLTTFSTLTFYCFPSGWVLYECVSAQVCNCLCVLSGALLPDMLIAGFHLLQMCV